MNSYSFSCCIRSFNLSHNKPLTVEGAQVVLTLDPVPPGTNLLRPNGLCSVENKR